MNRKIIRDQSRESSEKDSSSRARTKRSIFLRWIAASASPPRNDILPDSRLWLLITLFSLAACGFQPLHARSYRDQQNIDLSSIAITVDHSRSGQLLEAEIKDAINPDYEHHEKLYALNITITGTEVRLFINPDGTSSRTDIPLTSTYTLTRIRDGKVLDTGTITRISSYNTSSADYSSYVSIQDAKKRGVTELAQDYRLRLANVLANLQQKAMP